MNILDFKKKKIAGEKISMMTCYDYTSARILSQTEIDGILIGDSVAMTLYGYPNTLAATVEMMRQHTMAVRRGASKKFLVTDLPFLSFKKSLSQTITIAQQLMREGTNALKIEGAQGNLKMIKYLTESGVPIMGHVGFTMQHMHTVGNAIVCGKTVESATQLQEEAYALQEAGCFAIVLECIVPRVAQAITQSLTIPVIGIGAGPFTDGQILVFQDVLGLNVDFKPKFVKAFSDGQKQQQMGINHFVHAVKEGAFPSDEHCYHF